MSDWLNDVMATILIESTKTIISPIWTFRCER